MTDAGVSDKSPHHLQVVGLAGTRLEEVDDQRGRLGRELPRLEFEKKLPVFFRHAQVRRRAPGLERLAATDEDEACDSTRVVDGVSQGHVTEATVGHKRK